MTPCRALTATGDSVRTCMPSLTVVVHPVWTLGIHAISGWPSGPTTGWRSGPSRGVPISTTQMRQAPSGGSFWCEQKIGTSTSAARAASVTSVPAGTSTVRPLMVTAQSLLMPSPPAPRRPRRGAGSPGSAGA